MDTDLSHEALKKFEELHQRLLKVEEHLGFHDEELAPEHDPDKEVA